MTTVPDELFAVPTCREDIQIGDEVDLPDVDHLVTVRGTGVDAVRGESGVVRTVYQFIYYLPDGTRGVSRGERLEMVNRYLPLQEVKLDASYGQVDAERSTELIPALVEEIERLRRREAEARQLRGSQ